VWGCTCLPRLAACACLPILGKGQMQSVKGHAPLPKQALQTEQTCLVKLKLPRQKCASGTFPERRGKGAQSNTTPSTFLEAMCSGSNSSSNGRGLLASFLLCGHLACPGHHTNHHARASVSAISSETFSYLLHDTPPLNSYLLRHALGRAVVCLLPSFQRLLSTPAPPPPHQQQHHHLHRPSH